MIIALTGFMMCGKSSYGRALAALCDREFIDLDDHIEEGVAAGDIIRAKGEATFREEETAALKRVLEDKDDCILALGGGTPMREENRELLRLHCKTIWIKASLEESVFNEDWKELAAKRPLLGDRERTEALWQSRIPIYEAAADYVVETDGKEPEQVLAELIACIND